MKNASFACLLGWAILTPSFLFGQIVNIEELRITGTNDSTYWYGQASFGANAAKVQDEVWQFDASAHLQRKKKRNLTLLLLDASLLRAGNEDFSNAGFAHLRHNYKLTDRWTAEGFVQAQYNHLQLIKFRGLAGAGLRYRLFKDKSGNNRIYAGVAWLFEQNRFLISEGNNRSHWHRLSSYLSFTFRPWEGVKLSGTTYYQPQVFRAGNFRFSTCWKLEMPLNERLSFSTAFNYGLDNALPDGAAASTYSWSNCLAFEF